ncbi:HAD-IIIA family hydrolase [Aestuariimicrobium ganziense]|uniref:HAD-IIIA family hydrolase n=1 Tax=Aestuariimicrobium ganziense TaxID=2773677 RepID=UPI0019411D73|nr:HAD-IIIA family hydrolase [Aestuariimicrobium ganziense]
MRIAHLTDLHLRHHLPGSATIQIRRSRRMPELFARALGDARSRGADVVVVTGDLVDVPDHLFARERDAALDAPRWEQARRDYELVLGLLEDCGLPWLALPGNHDSQRVMREVFGDRERAVEIDGVRFVAFWDQEWQAHRPQRILDDRVLFDAVLMGEDETPQVHLQHYLITPRIDESYPHTYLEAEWLRDRLVASGRVPLALSGHYHPGCEPDRLGTTTFSVTPALCEAPHRYRLFDLDPTRPDEAPNWEQVALEPEVEAAPVVFLDRDGCINTLPAYDTGPEAMELLPGAAEGIGRLRQAGYRVVVVTNQACVGAGHVTAAVVDEVHDRMSELLAEQGTEVDAVYSSFEAGPRAVAPQFATADTRKPSPAMLRQAARELNLDLTRAVMVGDRAGDLEAGRAAGARVVLVRTGFGARTEDEGHHGDAEVVDDLVGLADRLPR